MSVRERERANEMTTLPLKYDIGNSFRNSDIEFYRKMKTIFTKRNQKLNVNSKAVQKPNASGENVETVI